MLVLTAGFIFVILGLLGLAVPFLQGILFLIIGLMLLSIASSRTRKWIESQAGHHPKMYAAARKMEKWITKIIGPVD